MRTMPEKVVGATAVCNACLRHREPVLPQCLQSQMGISNFKTWANTQVAARSITFDIKPMQSPQ